MMAVIYDFNDSKDLSKVGSRSKLLIIILTRWVRYAQLICMWDQKFHFVCTRYHELHSSFLWKANVASWEICLSFASVSINNSLLCSLGQQHSFTRRRSCFVTSISYQSFFFRYSLAGTISSPTKINAVRSCGKEFVAVDCSNMDPSRGCLLFIFL